ncbi:Intracellular endo-alpha-(1-_5)-L-arabinanase, partial [Fusarium oxysporum f. sp. albedinis]
DTVDYPVVETSRQWSGRNREQVNKPEARHLSVDAVGHQEARMGRPWRGWKLMQANRPAAKPVPYTGIRHAAGRLFSERGERQEYVLVGGRRNRVFGDKEVNGSCGTATKRFFLQSL